LDGSCRLALTEDDLKDGRRGQIARFVIPAFAGIVDRGRLTASAKAQRRTLREMVARRRPEPSA
jgi:acyl-CoA synthetase (AMP-forming)/AMP-acid ligase II